MTTQELINEFLQSCQDRGLARSTYFRYKSHLRHFAQAFPDSVPWDWPLIEKFLTKVIKKKDARPQVRKSLGAFYSYLEQKDYGISPIPRGKVGRPKKEKDNSSGLLATNFAEKLVGGGPYSTIRVEVHHYFHGPGGRITISQ